MKRLLPLTLIAVLAIATGAAAAPQDRCAAPGYCESHLRSTDGSVGAWTSHYEIAPAGDVSVNVFAGGKRLGLVGVTASGCRAWFRGHGAHVRVSICDPGWSPVDVAYRSPAPVLLRLQTR